MDDESLTCGTYAGEPLLTLLYLYRDYAMSANDFRSLFDGITRNIMIDPAGELPSLLEILAGAVYGSSDDEMLEEIWDRFDDPNLLSTALTVLPQLESLTREHYGQTIWSSTVFSGQLDG